MAEDEEIRRALQGVESLYSGNLAEHGIDSRSVGWPDPDAQLVRFQKLAHLLVEDDGGPRTVNDWGCGYGAMFKFLDELKGFALDRYYGYDVSREMLDAARAHVSDARAEWIQSSELSHDADYSFVSGTFNVRMESSVSAWTAYVRSVLHELHARSRRGFAFNLLTSYVDWEQEDLFYAPPSEFFDFCKRELSPYVTLIHDYPLFEWTMVVRRDAPRR
jgi:SAM-dependent methyltransferase